MKKIVLLLIFLSFSLGNAQEPGMLEETWYLKYLRVNNERLYVPQGENFNLIFSEDNGNYTILANGVENGFEGEISFSSSGDFFQFTSANITLLSCDLPNCYYENHYFFDFLTSMDFDLKTLEYDYDTFSLGLKSLRLNGPDNTVAYFGNEPPIPDDTLFGTWYLYQQDTDLGDSQYFTGPDVPRLTINPDFTFEGIDNCGEILGQFEYGEDSVVDFFLIPSNINDPNPGCTRTLYDLLDENPIYAVHFDNFLYYESFPGFGSHFRDELLGTQENVWSAIKLYPNPVLNTLHIYDPENIVDSYAITDMSGKIIKQGVHSNSAVSVSNFTSGVYFLKLQSGENQTIKKLIKN